MTTHENPHEQAQILQGMVEAIDPDTPVASQVAEETAVHELLSEFEDHEAFGVVAQALLSRAKARHPAFQERGKASYPALFEVTPESIHEAQEALLSGETTAVVIRKGTYEDFGTEILRPLLESTGLKLAGKEQFPKERQALGHSSVHLDNFIGLVERDKPCWKYSMSLSRIDQGEALFVAALAAPRVRGWGDDQYNAAHRSINGSRRVKGLRERAMDRVNPRGVGNTEWEEQNRAVSGEFVATSLHEGDIVMWAQGGEGSAMPAWHGFVQIGHPSKPGFKQRESTSYHLAPQGK